MEPILATLIVFGFAAFIVKMGIDYSKWKRQHASGEGATSMRTSELQELVREAVEEANAPLRERLDALQQQLEEQRTPSLMSPSEKSGSP